MTLDAKEQLTGNIWGNVEPVLFNTFQTLLQNFFASHRIQPKMQSTEIEVKYLFIFILLFLGFNPKY